MRDVKYIVLHCTATPQNTTIESILRYWRVDLGWKNPGYHYIIKADGEVVNLLPIEQISNGVAGYNTPSIHISYIGGVDSKGKALDNRTPAQIASQIRLIRLLKAKFPKAEIKGHRDFPNVKKDCPSFDVRTWLKTVGLACLLLLLFAACKTKTVYVSTPSTVVEKTNTLRVRDTAFVIEQDSSFYNAWIECINNKPVLRNPEATKGKNQLQKPQVILDANGQLNVACVADVIRLQAQIKELESRELIKEYVTVEVERKFTFFQKLFINLGKGFGLILLILLGYAAFKLVSKYYVR